MTIRLLLAIAAVCAATTGCKSRPGIDSGYRPSLIQEIGTSTALPSTDRSQDDLQGLHYGQNTHSEWEPFDGRPPIARDEQLEEISDRRWGPIYFAYNQSFIGETERIKLEQLADYLVQDKKFHIIIEGHCDKQGSDEFNRVLGEQRALAIRDYMISLNVTPDRIQTISYGEDRPVDPGETEESYARNRRAEFIIGLPKKNL